MTTTKTPKSCYSTPPRPAYRTGRGQGMRRLISHLEERDKNLSWLAAKIGKSRQAVSAWDEVPPKHLRKIRAHTGLSAQELRPDLFK